MKEKERTKFLFWQIEQHMVLLFGPEDALIFSYLCNKYKYFEEKGMLDEDGYFFLKQKYIEEETGLSAHRQLQSLNRLEEWHLISSTIKNWPRSKYYKIEFVNKKKLEKVVEKMAEKKSYSIRGRRITLAKVFSQWIPKISDSYIKNIQSKNIQTRTFLSKKKENKRYTSNAVCTGGAKRRSETASERQGAPCSTEINKMTKECLAIWNSGTYTRKHLQESKVLKQSRKALKELFSGTLFKNIPRYVSMWCENKFFNVQDFETAFRNYELAFNKDRLPINKDKLKTSLFSFLYNSYADDSYFLFFYQSEPKFSKVTAISKFENRKPERKHPVRIRKGVSRLRRREGGEEDVPTRKRRFKTPSQIWEEANSKGEQIDYDEAYERSEKYNRK